MSCNAWNWTIRLAIATAITLAFVLIARAEDFTVSEVVEAIGKAENSSKFPFGIKSIDTKGDYEYAKRICRNSVINNYKRWIKAGKPKPFLEFMRDRFAPLSDSKLNQYWVSNVKYFLVKNRQVNNVR